MQLFYYQAPQGNVGDDLNAWLWPKLLKDILDQNNQHLFIGIGTLLNSKLPVAKKYTVVSSGVGYHNRPNFNSLTWDVRALRGPLSQQALGIEKALCLLDGAYLMPRFFWPKEIQQRNIGYIPHIDSIFNGNWQQVSNLAGAKLLDPRWPVERFITELLSCRQVITEAMHGAILADAYQIPWQPAKAYAYINEFKWHDWLGSLNIKNVSFTTLEPIWNGDSGLTIGRKLINNTKRFSKWLGYYPNHWDKVSPQKSSEKVIEQNALTLRNAFNNQFITSDYKLAKARTDLLQEEVYNLRHEFT